MAGGPPIPSNGIIKTRRASEGIVWMIPTMPRTTCPNFGSFAEMIPSGIDIIIAADNEIATSKRCSPV